MPLGVRSPKKKSRRYMGLRRSCRYLARDRCHDRKGHRCSGKGLLAQTMYPRLSPSRSKAIRSRFADRTLESSSLARNLAGCTQCVLFAATAGPFCDMLVKRASVTSSAYASCCQAAGAAAIEAYCDLINDKIKDEYEAKGLFARPRFSPGYGDLPLENQKDWFRLLDITRNTGIELTGSLLMVPTKSVTAIIGLSPDRLPCVRQGCESCTMSSACTFSRKE